MKTLFRLSLAVLVCLCATFGATAQDVVKKKVAVYVTGSDVDESIKKVLGAKLVTAITSSGDFAAVERTADFLAAMNKENDYQTSGEVRDNQIAKLGQKFGVKYVVVADASEAFGELFIASRLINVETGLVEKAYDANGEAESMQQLIKLSQDVANGLLQGLSRGPGGGNSYSNNSGGIVEASQRVNRNYAGITDMEKTILRWYFDSDPRGARIFWRVISSVPNEVKNTSEMYLTTTPFEETRSFNIQGLTYENSHDVTIEIKVSKRGYEDQVKRFNVRQVLDQQEISGFFELVPKESYGEP